MKLIAMAYETLGLLGALTSFGALEKILGLYQSNQLTKHCSTRLEAEETGDRFSQETGRPTRICEQYTPFGTIYVVRDDQGRLVPSYLHQDLSLDDVLTLLEAPEESPPAARHSAPRVASRT